MSGSTTPRAFIVDASYMQYRAHYVTEQRQSYTKEGIPNAAVLLLRKMLDKLKRDYSPDVMVAGCDSASPTFRKKLYADYKANREAPPADYAAQHPGFLESFNKEQIPTFAAEGFEADDVIGTLAKQYSEQGHDVTIISGDKDMNQLVSISHDNGCVSVLNTNKNRLLGPFEVLEVFGVWPHEIPDYLALVGDTSDNIPGAKGIGPKGAVELIKQFDCVEEMIQRAGEISSGHLRHNVVIYKEWILLSKKLTVIDCAAPIQRTS